MKRLFSFAAAYLDVPRQDTTVRVAAGYRPDTVHAEAGRPVQITFRREEDSPCSEQVVFPDFGVATQLPQDEDVMVELLPTEPGEYGFECGTGMLHGRLVVDAPETPAREPLGTTNPKD